MAIYLPETQTVFVHIPRTGGTWVRKALDVCGIKWVGYTRPDRFLPINHCHLAHYYKDQRPVSNSFTFVRHPVLMYRSVWRYFTVGDAVERTMKFRWHPLKVAAKEWNENYSSWIDDMCTRHPGWLSRLYEFYIGPERGEFIKFVGRTERLQEDFIRIVRDLNHTHEVYYSVDEDRLTEIGMINSFGTSAFESGGRMDQILESEKEAVLRFYGDGMR